MAKRYSDAFNICKNDIGKTVFKKSFKQIYEWWIYRKADSRFLDATGKNLKTDEDYLYCVIACGDQHGVRQENASFIAVEGWKFTENDLKEYLLKTGRNDGLFKLPEIDDNNDKPTTVKAV